MGARLAGHECGHWYFGAALTKNMQEGGGVFGGPGRSENGLQIGPASKPPPHLSSVCGINYARTAPRTDTSRRWMDSVVRTAQSRRLQEVCGSALEMP